MASTDVAAVLVPENEQAEKLNEEVEAGGVSATIGAKEVVQVEDDDDDNNEEEEWNVAQKVTEPEDSAAEKDEGEEGTAGTWDDDEDDEE